MKIGDKVQVYFTRNGKIIGKKEVVLPKGGFYPTVGMMSSQEKVGTRIINHLCSDIDRIKFSQRREFLVESLGFIVVTL